MTRHTQTTTRAVFACVFAFAFAVSPNASAADVESCATAAENAERSFKKQQLIEARKQLAGCLDATCPKVLRETCGQMLRDVDSALPSIVVVVREGIADVTSPTVLVDGQASSAAASGKAVDLNPGPHKIEIKTRSGKTKIEDIVARSGDQRRVVTIDFPADPKTTTTSTSQATKETEPPQEPPRKKTPAWIGWGLIGVSAVGFGSFGYFGVTSRSDVNKMQTECQPFCDQDRIDSARTKALVADISLGVGIVALAAGAYFLVFDR